MSKQTKYQRTLKLVEAVNQKPDDMTYPKAYAHFGALYYPVQHKAYTAEVTDENLSDYINFVTTEL